VETSFAILFYSTQQYLIVLLVQLYYCVDLVVLHVHAKFSTKFRATTTAVLPVLNLVLNLVYQQLY
jgi:hypothetical protein